MAPRALETLAQFAERFRTSARKGAQELRFGGHHHTHAVRFEDGVWRVRPLVLDSGKAEAYRAEHGYFMPETAEMLSEPGDEILCEGTVAEVIAKLRSIWPRS